MVASNDEILSALLFEKEELFQSLCYPEVSDEGESEEPIDPIKPELQVRDQFGKSIN